MRASLPSGGAALAVAVLLVATTVTRDPANWPSEWRFACWIAVLLTSFLGWGTIATRAFGTDSLRGFVRLGLGIAAFIAVSGFFLAVHVLSFMVLAALVVVGLTATLWCAFNAAVRRIRSRASGTGADIRGLSGPSFADLTYWAGAALVLLLGALRIVGSAKTTLGWWDADDSPAYFAFVRELTQRGSFDQDFSFRRLVAYGGQTILQAVTCLGVPVRSANVLDIGICPFVMVGMVLQVGRGRWLAIAAALLLVLLPTSAFNSGSNFSGSLLVLVVYFSLRFAANESARRGGALTGMSAAALCTLRHSFIPVVGALLVVAAVAHLTDPRVKTRRERFAFSFAAALAFALTIAPFCVASLVAAHTPLFPLIHGTYRSGGVDLGAEGPIWLTGLVGIFSNPPPAPQLLIVFAAILALGSRLSRASLVPLALGTLACTLLLARTSPVNPQDNLRYLAAPWIGLMIAFYCEALLGPGGAEPSAREGVPILGVVTVLAAVQLGYALPPGLGGVFENVLVRRVWPRWEDERTTHDAARALQKHIPRGAKVLTACDRVYDYDFARNKLVLVDLPFVAGPVELPDEKATPQDYENVITELRRHGIDYLLFSDPDASLAMYSAQRWGGFVNDGYHTHELLVPRFMAWFAFERYVTAHRQIVGKRGIDRVAVLGKS